MCGRYIVCKQQRKRTGLWEVRTMPVITRVMWLSPFQRPFSRWTWVSRYRSVSILDLLEIKVMEVVVTTGAIRRATPVKVSPSTNQHPSFLTGRGLTSRTRYSRYTLGDVPSVQLLLPSSLCCFTDTRCISVRKKVTCHWLHTDKCSGDWQLPLISKCCD